jgi:two-component system nitrate/nitrite response regulator NarL
MSPAPVDQRPIRVLLVDDHRSFAQVLAMRLASEPSIAEVVVAFSIGDGLAMALRHRPDVALVDLHLAGESGLDLIAGLESVPAPPAVVVVSGARDTGSIVAALEAGALAWVPKDSSVEDLLTAADEVLQGHAFLPPRLLRPVVRNLLDKAHAANGEETFLDTLSIREMEVLRCLVSGMTRAEAAERLFVSTNTVRTHVQNVLRRADVHSTLALVAKARELGVLGIDEVAKPSPA